MGVNDGGREWNWAITGLGGLITILDSLGAAGAVPSPDDVTELENHLRKLEPIKNRLVAQRGQQASSDDNDGE